MNLSSEIATRTTCNILYKQPLLGSILMDIRPDKAMSKHRAEVRYLTDAYALSNPTWDEEDSAWKAALVCEILRDAALYPKRIADVGCGAGGVLATLRSSFVEAHLAGFDIAPGAAKLWQQHASARVEYIQGDFLDVRNEQRYDLIMLLDVLEHLPDPIAFLTDVAPRADYFVFHFPLDLSVSTVLRETPLLYARRKVGHLHYYTKSLALALLEECGYETVIWRYTGAGLNAPRRRWKTRLAGIARRIASYINRDFGVRLLGGETLIVLARPR